MFTTNYIGSSVVVFLWPRWFSFRMLNDWKESHGKRGFYDNNYISSSSSVLFPNTYWLAQQLPYPCTCWTRLYEKVMPDHVIPNCCVTEVNFNTILETLAFCHLSLMSQIIWNALLHSVNHRPLRIIFLQSSPMFLCAKIASNAKSLSSVATYSDRLTICSSSISWIHEVLGWWVRNVTDNGWKKKHRSQ